VDLNKNCSEYAQGKADSDNVKIRRNYDVTFVRLKLERVYSTR